MQEATTRAAARRGLADAAPLMLSYVPFGLILGAAIAASDLDLLAGWASSPIVFAGASQLAIVDLLDGGAAAVVVIATALVINLRHVMYSAGLAPHFRRHPRWWQIAAPYLLVDPVYTLSIVRFEELDRPAAQRAYYVALGAAVWANWLATTAAGVVVGAALPPEWNLDFAVPLTFIALLVPTVTDRPTLLAATVGAVVVVAGRPIPLELNLFVAILAGIAAGLALETWSQREDPA